MENSSISYTAFDDNVNRLIKITEPEAPFLFRSFDSQGQQIPVITRELWTSQQRQAHSLHEISYRACFKPQLPRFFISKLTSEDDVIYDPFAGRGTTVLEAALLDRRIISNDINPLSAILLAPRLRPPLPTSVSDRLKCIPKSSKHPSDVDLTMFFEKNTLSEILAIREYMQERIKNKQLDYIDEWIRMVATNRLTGHSSGFFSVYTLPPNQATSAESQIKINEKYNQIPTYKDTHKLIMKKTRALLKDLRDDERNVLFEVAKTAQLYTSDARSTMMIKDNTVALTITSPPFLDIVQYASDNWLRCWFNMLDAKLISNSIATPRSIDVWKEIMEEVFVELYRITKRGGYVAFEVGEIRHGQIRLDEEVIPLAAKAKFNPVGVLLNEQVFTKTSHIWGVANNQLGTNTNRIVLLRKV